MSAPLKAVKRRLTSPGTSLTLIVAAAAAAVGAFFFPRAYAYSSPGFLALSLAAVIVLAVSVRFQLRGASGGPRPLAVLEPSEAAVASVLGRRGYAPVAASGRTTARVLFFEKGRAGRWGAAVFHAGLLLAIVAGLCVYALSQRGFVPLMEGETFGGSEGELARLDRGPLAGAWRAPFGLRLERFRDARWDDGTPRSVESLLTVLRGGRAEQASAASINGPLAIAGMDVYQSTRYGRVVSLALRRGSGTPLVGNYLLDEPSRPGRPALGRSDFPGPGYWLELSLRAADGAGAAPTLDLTVVGRGRRLYRGALRLGESARVDGGTLTWISLRRWSGLIIARQPGMRLAYAAFALCVAGGLLMVLLPHRELRVERSAGAWRISVVSRAETALVEEDAAWAQAQLALAEARVPGEVGDGRSGVL